MLAKFSVINCAEDQPFSQSHSKIVPSSLSAMVTSIQPVNHMKRVPCRWRPSRGGFFFWLVKHCC